MQRFTIKHDANGTFTDRSLAGESFERDSFPLPLISATGVLWIGYTKPFSYFYNELFPANTNAAELTIEYFDTVDNALKKVPNLDDETEGYTRSGFITFDRPEKDTNESLWKKTTINNVELFWLKITTDTDFSAGTIFKGINILFSNDQDLIEEKSNIVSKHADDEPTKTWVIKHQAARKEIIQRLRNQGRRKTTIESFEGVQRFLDLDQFDILRLDQLRQASKWLVLSKIYIQELSDNVEDKWMASGEDFEEKYNDAFDVFQLSIDANDDGEEDAVENQEDVKRIALSFT